MSPADPDVTVSAYVTRVRSDWVCNRFQAQFATNVMIIISLSDGCPKIAIFCA